MGKYILDPGENDDAVTREKHDSEEDCKFCAVGKEFFSPSECKICGFSHYQDQDDVAGVQCKTCPVNTFNSDDRLLIGAHLTAANCIPCQNGTFSERGDRGCVTCAAGKEPSATDCVDCGQGQYSPIDTDLKCTQCPEGWYQDKPSKQYCFPCIRKQNLISF